MKLSAFGRRLTGESGTRLLMNDLGEAVTTGGGIVNLGGGNPNPPALRRSGGARP